MDSSFWLRSAISNSVPVIVLNSPAPRSSDGTLQQCWSSTPAWHGTSEAQAHAVFSQLASLVRDCKAMEAIHVKSWQETHSGPPRRSQNSVQVPLLPPNHATPSRSPWFVTVSRPPLLRHGKSTKFGLRLKCEFCFNLCQHCWRRGMAGHNRSGADCRAGRALIGLGASRAPPPLHPSRHYPQFIPGRRRR